MGLMELLKRSGKDASQPTVVLAELNRLKHPVMVEIETVSAHFYSKVLLRSGAVVLTYPQSLEKYIKVDRWVRLRPDEEDPHELRLQISSVRYGGSGPMAVELGQMSMLCRIPSATYEETKRASARMNTSQFRDVKLALPGHSTTYSIINLSTGGMRIRLPEDDEGEVFEVGKITARVAGILLGKKARIEVVKLVTRNRDEKTVGLEMEVKEEGQSRKILDVFLSGLRWEAHKKKD